MSKHKLIHVFRKGSPVFKTEMLMRETRKLRGLFICAVSTALLSTVILAQSEQRTIYVDLAGTTAEPGWNLVSFDSVAAPVALKDTNQAPVGISMRILVRLGINSNGAAATVGDAAEFAPAGMQNSFGYNTNHASPAVPKGVALLRGLNPGVPYTFTFYASRSGVYDNRSTLYRLLGSSSGSNTLNAAGNNSEVAVVADIYPTDQGEVILEVTKGPDNNNSSDFFYIAAMKITCEAYTVQEQPEDGIAGKRLLFFGNSFSQQGNVPAQVGRLAELAGHPSPLVVSDLMGGQDLAYHISQIDSYPENNVTNAALSGTNTWDHVIIQGYSTEATRLRDATIFRSNALALYRRVKDHASGKGAGVQPILYQTWARAFGHSYYPGTFPDPYQMQQEIRTNYQAAAELILAEKPGGDVRISRAGDAFELGAFNAADLYASDLYHAGILGQHLAALMLYKTIYRATVTNIAYETVVQGYWTSVSRADWERITTWADAIPEYVPDTRVRRAVYIDAYGNNGPQNWNNLEFRTVNNTALLIDSMTNATGIRATVDVPIPSSNTYSMTPTGDAAEFAPAGNNAAFGQSGNTPPYGLVAFSALNTNTAYTFTFFGSRKDKSDNRETRHTVTGSNTGYADLDASSNDSNVAEVSDIYPRPDGTITVKFERSPNNQDQYYYLTAMKIAYAETATPEPTKPGAASKDVLLLDVAVNSEHPVYPGWNYLRFNQVGSLQKMVLTNGYATDIACEVVTRMNNVNAYGAASLSGAARVFEAAQNNAAFGNINPFGTSAYSNQFCEVRYSGLNLRRVYTFIFFASRMAGSGSLQTLYLVDGANSGSNVLEPRDNSSEVAVVPRIQPTPEGTITVRITAGPNNASNELFYYLSAMMIESVVSGMIVSVK